MKFRKVVLRLKSGKFRGILHTPLGAVAMGLGIAYDSQTDVQAWLDYQMQQAIASYEVVLDEETAFDRSYG